SSLETPRLLLRPFEAGDVAAYAAIRSKPEVIRFLPGGVERARHANDVASQIVTDFAMPWRERAGYAPWAVITKSDGLLRGHLGLRVLAEEGGRTELLYMLDSAVWGHGLATEGALATRDFAFDQLHLRHIIAMALPENTASMRVMVKIGMVREPGLVKAFGLDVVRFNLAAPLDMA
ncbi:MAG: GNAT family N-acetyltransferase, partial [Thalassobaculaceae bacterium]